MINVAISGASGKMGMTLINSVLNQEDLTLTAAIDHPQSEVLGKDAATIPGQDACGIEVSAQLDNNFDVLIDFTRPEATMNYLRYCLDNNKAIVIGTTGFTPDQLQQLDEAGKQIKIMRAPNMSVGVNLSFKLMQMAAQALGEDADVEIIEAHHKHKVDAPSGTAIAMGELIATELGRDLQYDGVFARHGHTGERKPEQIGFSVIRAGDIVGEHTAMFALDGERIEITHKAANRNIYASGALRAARWLVGQSTAGLYNMENVLGLG